MNPQQRGPVDEEERGTATPEPPPDPDEPENDPSILLGYN